MSSRFQPRKNFTGARDVSAVHSLMTKWALLAVAGFLGCSLSLSAQEVDLLALNQPGQGAVNSRAAFFGALNGSYLNSSPAVTLADGRPISLLNGYDWMEPMTLDFLPAVSADKVTPRVSSTANVRQDSSDKVVAAKPKFFDYVGGEVGVLYGHSVGGKFSCEVEQGYILGEMGNDTTHIIVGASYERSSGRISRH